MAQMSQSNPDNVTVDSSLFSVGFLIGLILGKMVLKNTMLAVAFGTGLGLAVGSSQNAQRAITPTTR
jgi:hypothetical protein